ncbi:MAG: multiheme c-type cytochrome [bacterium]|nr:multiheme c-type cytochrome [bacterium]
MKLSLKLPIYTILVLLVTNSVFSEDSKYLGTGSCSSSNCHGSVNPIKGSRILQNEYVTWVKKDAHSKAWRILTNEDSKKIAHNLGIGEPSKETLCLNCHSTNIPSHLRGEKYSIEDGVTCESCHGAAENWLKSHASSKTSHNENLENGMRDLVSLEKRSEFCLSCHLGTDNKFVNHKMIGAGHPRLSFELDTFSMTQPKHWELDTDYQERKASYEPIRAWLIGQTQISIQTVKLLASDKRTKNGIWPELSLFNCYACHHSLTSKQWLKREYKYGPGELRLNLSSLLVVKESLSILDNELATLISLKLEELHEQYKVGKAQPLLKSMEEILSNQIIKLVSKDPLNSVTARKLLQKIVSLAANTPHFQYEEAEQLAMGISAILSSNKPLEKKLFKQVEALYTSLRSPEEFVAEEFRESARELLHSDEFQH